MSQEFYEIKISSGYGDFGSISIRLVYEGLISRYMYFDSLSDELKEKYMFIPRNELNQKLLSEIILYSDKKNFMEYKSKWPNEVLDTGSGYRFVIIDEDGNNNMIYMRWCDPKVNALMVKLWLLLPEELREEWGIKNKFCSYQDYHD